MTVVAEEAFSNVRTVKAFANEDEEVAKFLKGNVGVEKIGMKKTYLQAGFSFFQQLFLYGSMAIIVKLGIYLYNNNMSTIGAITSFLFYMLMLLWNCIVIAWSFGNIFSVLGAADKVVDIITHKALMQSTGGDKPEGEILGCITLKNVKFQYPSMKEVMVLKGVDIQVDNEKKRVVALCGTSGCGKSSVIQMVERFYDPIEGQVLFNGKDIRELDPKWYHE
jgi:ABC-type multidrug transport system fused ATPase/permease subunit